MDTKTPMEGKLSQAKLIKN